MKKILVYRTGSIGDAVIALPAFWAIRKNFPNAEIILLSNGKNEAEIVANKVLPNGIFNGYIAYSNSIKLISLAFLLKREKFDAVFYLMNRQRIPARVKRDILFFKFVGIKKIIGSDYLIDNYLTKPKSRPLHPIETEKEYLINCLSNNSLIDVSKIDSKLEIALTYEEKKVAKQWLENNCDTSKKIIAVMPDSNWSSKNWAEKYYLETVKRLIAENNVYPIVFGGKNDFEKANRLIKAWKIGANVCGLLGIRVDAALLEHCKLYLGNDTGTMHLASSVNIPCVTVFAATDYPNRWFPSGSQHISIRKQVECEGCFSPKCFNNNLCLQLITIDEVYQACVKILKSEQKKT
jgi:ADP-heptose:LPS heptosyltransferase